MLNIEKIYMEYFEVVYKYLLCLTHNRDLAEEIAQETFFKAIMKIHTFKEDCKLSTWLCQIAKNLWINELKHSKRLGTIENCEISYIASYENIEDTIVSNEEKERLYRKIKSLDPITREVMYIRITSDLSFKEIGCILGKNENWARVTFYRGKNKIKESNLYE